MKTLLIIAISIWSFSANSQTYEYGAAFTGDIFVKMSGQIIIDDKTVELVNDGETSRYDLIKKANGIVYFGSTIKIHELTIKEETGKKKGWKYTHAIYMTFNGVPITYYCVVEETGHGKDETW